MMLPRLRAAAPGGFVFGIDAAHFQMLGYAVTVLSTAIGAYGTLTKLPIIRAFFATRLAWDADMRSVKSTAAYAAQQAAAADQTVAALTELVAAHKASFDAHVEELKHQKTLTVSLTAFVNHVIQHAIAVEEELVKRGFTVESKMPAIPDDLRDVLDD
jgi:histidinol-phosphate/aromatic aminotransferase/cobyric acid decarboxylase-like protein